MPNIDLSILNQRQTPAFYADTLANRPAAGFVGRIFVSTNTFAFYRDNGTSWDLIGGPGTGTVTGSGAAGQVTYWNGASTITGTNNLFYDTANSRLGVNTNTPTNAFDVHSSVSPIVGLNQTTATNNSLLVLLNSGTALWRIGSFYNAGANDFGVFDVVGAIQPITIKKTTGQVLIGTSTVGSGKLVVASATGDNGVQIVGAIAPSLRIDNAESGPTKRAGFGISTGANNFIQGSVDGDVCLFSGSTTSSPLLFGIYGTTNVLEAARISAARNLLVGTVTDAGQKLQVAGNVRVTGGYNGTTGTFDTGNTVTPAFIVTGGGNSVGGGKGNIRSSDSGGGNYWDFGRDNLTTGNFVFSNLGGTPFMSLTTVTGNLLIGTTTDAGQKLQVRGTSSFNSISCVSNTAYTKHGLVCVNRQDASTITLSTIFPNVDFNGNFISLQIQIFSSDGALPNSSIINCVRDFTTVWNYSLVSTVGTANVLTLTFGGTSAAPTLRITGTLGNISSVLYSIVLT